MSGLLEYPFARLPPARWGEAHEAGRTVSKLGLLNNMWICLVTYDCRLRLSYLCRVIGKRTENHFPSWRKIFSQLEKNELGILNWISNWGWGRIPLGRKRDRKEEQGMKTKKTHAILKRAKRSRSCLRLWHDESDEPAHACLYAVPYLLGVGQTSKPFKCLSVVQMYDFQDIMPNTILHSIIFFLKSYWLFVMCWYSICILCKRNGERNKMETTKSRNPKMKAWENKN